MNKLYEICALIFTTETMAGDLAHVLNTNRRTCQRWLNGQNDIPDWVYDELKTYIKNQQNIYNQAIILLDNA